MVMEGDTGVRMEEGAMAGEIRLKGDQKGWKVRRLLRNYVDWSKLTVCCLLGVSLTLSPDRPASSLMSLAACRFPHPYKNRNDFTSTGWSPITSDYLPPPKSFRCHHV